ncbi:MAG: iron chaperone [Phycisphaerales bacterium JB063]
MPPPPPTTIPAYIDAAPAAGQPHLRKLYAILRKAAPQAEETIKWNTPFFVEPRFVYAFSAHKQHMGFTTTPETLEPFRDELADYEVTKMGILKLPYKNKLPEPLLRKIAKARVKALRDRDDDNFW